MSTKAAHVLLVKDLTADLCATWKSVIYKVCERNAKANKELVQLFVIWRYA